MSLFYLVGDGHAEALEAPLGPAEGIEEGLEVIHQQRHVDSIEADGLEGSVVDQRALAVADGVANDAKHLGVL